MRTTDIVVHTDDAELAAPSPMTLLAHGVPLTLLFDLMAPIRSWELLSEEVGDLAWIEHHAA